MALRRFLLALSAALAVVFTAEAAQAASLTVDNTTGRLGSGGEFKVTGFDHYFVPPAAGVTAIDGGQFNTFCMERGESIDLPGDYNYTRDIEAYNGGLGGGNPDPLGEAAAKLYYTFWADKWSVGDDLGYSLTFNYANAGGTRGFDGRDVQWALWFLEDEVTQGQLDAYVAFYGGSQAQEMVDYATDGGLSWADLGQLGWTGIGGVKILNLTDDAGNVAQSTIVVVPLPAAALMGFALLGGMGVVAGVRRRMRKPIA